MSDEVERSAADFMRAAMALSRAYLDPGWVCDPSPEMEGAADE